MQDTPLLRKHLSLDELLDKRAQIEDMDFWQRIHPQSKITHRTRPTPPGVDIPAGEQLSSYTDRLREEGYFQTAPILPPAMLSEMTECVATVKRHGFPVMFSLIYDVFYDAFAYFDAALSLALGSDYMLVPNFWVYDIDPSDTGKGFEPHRDAEYLDTIGEDGLPTVLTLWIAVTDATPLNSCMYIVPKDRDPQYDQAIHDLNTGGTEFALEDIRALPTKSGILSCWDQYVFHWGSRSSKRAPAPRISYALYCQRGDKPPIDGSVIDLRQGISFEQRLGLICKGMHRYSYVNVPSSEAPPASLLSFLTKHMDALKASLGVSATSRSVDCI